MDKLYEQQGKEYRRLKEVNEELLSAARQARLLLKLIPIDDKAYAPFTIEKLEKAIAKAEAK